MKKALFIAAVMIGSAAAVNAQDSTAITTSTTTTVTTVSTDQDGYASIKTEELPDAVKQALGSPSYKGWIINSASYNEKKEEYLVELKNGADVKKVKFDKDGKQL